MRNNNTKQNAPAKENVMDKKKNILKIGCDSGKVENAKIKGHAYEVEIFDEIVIEEGVTEIE